MSQSQDQDPNQPAGSQEDGQGQGDEKKYTEKEFNEKVSASLGAKLGPIPAGTLDFFTKNPRLLNEMLLTHSIVSNDSEMKARVQALTGSQGGDGEGQGGRGGGQATPVDVDKMLRDAETETGVAMADDTRKILRAFGAKLNLAHVQSAREIAKTTFQQDAPDVLRAATAEEQWDWVREQGDYKVDKTLQRLTRDKVQEAFVTKSGRKPIELLEETRKEVLALRGGKAYVPVVPGTSSQPRSTAPFAGTTQAAGSTQGNAQGGSPPGAPRVSRFKQAAEQISEQAWAEMTRGVPDKRSGGG